MKKKTALLLFIFFAGVIAVSVTLSSGLCSTKQIYASDTSVAGGSKSMSGPSEVLVPSGHLSVSSSLPTPFQIQQHLPLSFLFEIFRTSHYEEDLFPQSTTLYTTPLIKTLLRRIISPKGP